MCDAATVWESGFMVCWERRRRRGNTVKKKKINETMNTEYEKERKKDKEDDTNPLCMEKPSGPPSRLRSRADFRISYSTSAIYRTNIAYPV